jgi:hypothetical protein
MTTTEECPLCCEALSPADTIYALNCPTVACHFNYCCDCIQSLQRSAADGYSEASDGSNQLKVSVQCPQCRGKYESEVYNSRIIVHAVLILRQAHTLSDTLGLVDSELPASGLQIKHAFLRETSMEDLQDAVRRLDVYHKEHGVHTIVPPLDWKEWSRYLPATRDQTASLPSSGSDISQGPPFLDPTLFMGLEELMTKDEQEFVTEMLCCGKAEPLQQAAHILHGILHVTSSRNAASAVYQFSLSTGTSGGMNSTTAGAKKIPLTKQELADIQLTRKRWPLPTRMPRCVSLPVYDPQARAKLLKFKKSVAAASASAESDACATDLVLAQVRGPAGRSGIRVNDVVTHIQGERVTSLVEFDTAMGRELAENPDDGSVLIVVNADDEIANLLYERSQKIKEHQEQVRQQHRRTP